MDGCRITSRAVSALAMRLLIILVFSSMFLLGGCAAPDRSILTKQGDENLDCTGLKAEFDFAAQLGDNAPARRRHIRALQEEKQCVTPPKVTISIGVSKSFN